MIALLALLAPAWAQDPGGPDRTFDGGGFDAHGFRLVSHDSDLRDPLTFLRPGDAEAGQFYVGGQVEYANRPLLLAPSGDTRLPVIQNLLGANLAAGAVPVGPLRVDASLPVYASSQNELDLANGAALGDLRLSAMASPLQPADTGGVGVGLVAAVDLPTGRPDLFLGTSGVAGALGTTGTVVVDAYTASWSIGARFAPNTDADARPAPTVGGDTLQAAAAVGAIVTEQTGVTLEAHVDMPFDPSVRTAIGVPASALASVRYVLPSGGSVSAGLGAGLGLGAGASPIRLLVGGGFGTGADLGSRDLDADGIVDDDDQCPAEPEVVNGYDDTDGCPDELPWATIQLVVDGEPVPEAELLVERPDGRQDPGDGTVRLPVIPGAEYIVIGSLGDCLRTQQRLVPDASGGVIDVPLEAVLGTVVLTVTDSIGTPIPGATARYLIDDPYCQALSRDLVDGRGTHEMGIGRHQVFVTADGYDVFQATFELRQGQTKTIDARLNPVR